MVWASVKPVKRPLVIRGHLHHWNIITHLLWSLDRFDFKFTVEEWSPWMVTWEDNWPDCVMKKHTSSRNTGVFLSRKSLASSTMTGNSVNSSSSWRVWKETNRNSQILHTHLRYNSKTLENLSIDLEKIMSFIIVSCLKKIRQVILDEKWFEGKVDGRGGKRGQCQKPSHPPPPPSRPSDKLHLPKTPKTEWSWWCHMGLLFNSSLLLFFPSYMPITCKNVVCIKCLYACILL